MNKGFYTLIIIPLLFAFGANKKPVRSKYLPKNFVQVPAGKVFTKASNQDVILRNMKAGETKPDLGLDSCETFYIAQNETTNGEYYLFLSWLKTNGRIEEYNKNLPDTLVWRNQLAYNEPFVDYYFQHPAYAKYPVVGINLEQAKAYCSWLNQNYKSKKEGNASFFIPTKKEWIRAARGENTFIYPWGGPYLRNSKGVYLANFRTVNNSQIRLDPESNSYQVLSTSPELNDVFITTPANSYFPNQFGVYQMVGNVAELVADDTAAMGGSWNDVGYDIRIESEQSSTSPTSTIGFRVAARIVE